MMRDAAFFFVCLGAGVYLLLALVQWNINIAEWTQLARFVWGGALFVPTMAFLSRLYEVMTERR